MLSDLVPKHNPSPFLRPFTLSGSQMPSPAEFYQGTLLSPHRLPRWYLRAWLQPAGSIGRPTARSSPMPGVAMSWDDELVALRAGLPQGSNSYRILGRGGHLRLGTWGPDQRRGRSVGLGAGPAGLRPQRRATEFGVRSPPSAPRVRD